MGSLSPYKQLIQLHQRHGMWARWVDCPRWVGGLTLWLASRRPLVTLLSYSFYTEHMIELCYLLHKNMAIKKNWLPEVSGHKNMWASGWKEGLRTFPMSENFCTQHLECCMDEVKMFLQSMLILFSFCLFKIFLFLFFSFLQCPHFFLSCTSAL